MKHSRALVLLLILCGSTFAQSNPYGHLPVTQFGQPYLLLIRDPVVQGDLNLDAAQQAAVRRLTDKLDGGLWSMRNKSGNHVEKTVSDSIAKAKRAMAEILTRDQYRRMNQIVMWTVGMKAFARDDVSKSLGISADQRKEIDETMAATDKAIHDISEQLKSGGSRQALESKARDLRIDEQKKILAALTRQQQENWFAMLGHRIDVAKLGHVRFRAPEIEGQNEWINSPPLTLDKLKGKVVALHFFAFA